MADERKRLIGLGPDALADVLLELAARHEGVQDRVARLVASPKENVRRFRAKLAGLKRSTRFVPYRESGAFANELVALLADLEAGVDDPLSGLRLVAKFFEADDAIFSRSDDSSGSIGDVFRFNASDLFATYAARCDDKAAVRDVVFALLKDDDYGVRDSVVSCAASYLPETELRVLVERFWQRAREKADEYGRSGRLHLVESLAEQLRDAPLFERVRREGWPNLGTAACLDIARVYFDSGDATTALTWLERVPDTEHFQAYERNQLLAKVYDRLGRKEDHAKIAWRIFRSSRSAVGLDELLAVIGAEQRERVIAGETRLILENEALSTVDASFLIAVERLDDAESYLLERASQLNGEYYSSLLPLADAMETAGRELAASVIYRALLESILKRAISKYYTHGVRYLKK